MQSGNKLETVGTPKSGYTSASAQNTASARNSISHVENAFRAAQEKNPPRIVQKEEMEVELRGDVRAEKMRRLETRLKEETAAAREYDIDVKI